MGGKGKKRDPHLEIQAIPGYPPVPTSPLLTSVPRRGKGRKRNHVFCYYFCLFFIKEIIETRAFSPGPPLSGLLGEHTSLWFFIFLRSHHLSNREFLCAGGRLPSGGRSGETAARPGSRDQNTRHPKSTPAWHPAPQPGPGGQAPPCGALEEAGCESTPDPSANRGMASSAPLSLSPTHCSIKNDFVISLFLSLCVEGLEWARCGRRAWNGRGLDQAWEPVEGSGEAPEAGRSEADR